MSNGFEGIENKPDENNQAENKEFSLADLFDSVEKNVIAQVAEILGKSEEELTDQEREFFNNYVAYLKTSTMVSMGAGDFFGSMIPKSMHKPKREYTHKYFFPSIVALEKFIKEKKEDFEKDEAFRDISRDFKSGVYEEERGGTTSQRVYNRFVSDDGKVIIEELVDNYLGDGVNTTLSLITIINLSAGVKIDLGQMLPKGYSFSPAKMVRFEEKVDMERLEVQKKFYPVNLREYGGTKDSQDSFYVFKNLEQVFYGDLIKKGGILNLFHEIAHAWQNVYRSEEGREGFEFFFKHTLSWLNVFRDRQEELKNGSLTTEQYDRIVEYTTKRLGELGVEFDADDFIYHGQSLAEGFIIITGYKGERYVIKCNIFNSIKSNYEREEREAWAHALLMLRFMRKNGIDLEPEMKKTSDFEHHIGRCLESYQRVVEERIEIVGGKISFVRRK